MLVFSAWLAPLFRLPPPLFGIIATANLVYGSFSLYLALRRRRPVLLISILAAANALWGVVSLVVAAAVASRASVFGLAHLLIEAAVVIALARAEWRHRERLASA